MTHHLLKKYTLLLAPDIQYSDFCSKKTLVLTINQVNVLPKTTSNTVSGLQAHIGKDNLKYPCKLILTSFLALFTTAHQAKMGTTRVN